MTVLEAASISSTVVSRAALSEALSVTLGEPPEKSMVLPSWIGTGAGGPRRASTAGEK